MSAPQFTSIAHINKVIETALAKPGQKRPVPAANSAETYNVVIVVTRRTDEKTIEIADTTGRVMVTIRGWVPSQIKVARGLKIFGLRIERGVVYMTGKTYVRACKEEDWVDLSKIRCEENPTITSASFLELADQTHVTSHLYVRVCEIQPVKCTKGGKTKTQRILVADECNTFYVVFWNAAIKEYLPIFEQNLHKWVSMEDFTVNFYQGEPSVKLVEKTAEIRPITDLKMLDKLDLPERIVQQIEEAKGLITRGHIVHIDGATFRRYRKCGQCKVSVGMGADAVCNARDCKKFNVSKIEEGYSVGIVILNQVGETVHLKVTSELLQEEWITSLIQNDAEIDSDNIEEVFDNLQERLLSISYKAGKKENKDGVRDNWVQAWSAL